MPLRAKLLSISSRNVTDGRGTRWDKCRFSFADRQLAVTSPFPLKSKDKHPKTSPNPSTSLDIDPAPSHFQRLPAAQARPHCVGHRLTLSQEHGRAQEVLEVGMAQAPLRKLQPAEASRWKKPSNPTRCFCEAEAIRTMIHGRERFMRYKVYQSIS